MDTSRPTPEDAYMLAISIIFFAIGFIALIAAFIISIKFETL